MLLAAVGSESRPVFDIRAGFLAGRENTNGSNPNFGAAAPEPKDTLVLMLDARDNVVGKEPETETRLLFPDDGDGMRAGDWLSRVVYQLLHGVLTGVVKQYELPSMSRE
jgi:hypothetical protein